jgi:hypothetical protein
MLRFFEFKVLLQKIDFPRHHLPRRRIYSDTAPWRGMAAPRITRPFRAFKIRQRPRSAGEAPAGVPDPQEQLWRV